MNGHPGTARRPILVDGDLPPVFDFNTYPRRFSTMSRPVDPGHAQPGGNVVCEAAMGAGPDTHSHDASANGACTPGVRHVGHRSTLVPAAAVFAFLIVLITLLAWQWLLASTVLRQC